MSRINRRSMLVSGATALAVIGLGAQRAWTQSASPTITVYRNPT